MITVMQAPAGQRNTFNLSFDRMPTKDELQRVCDYLTITLDGYDAETAYFTLHAKKGLRALAEACAA